MGRGGWIILVVLGIAGAILLGVWAVSREDSQANAESSFCSSLDSLESNVQALTDLNPTSASKDDYESAVDDIESSWDDVKSDASNLVSVDMSTLDSAWDSFKSAVDDVPDDASVSDALNDVKGAAQSLASTVQSTLTGPDCSSS
jgi:hypothetical protein